MSKENTSPNCPDCDVAVGVSKATRSWVVTVAIILILVLVIFFLVMVVFHSLGWFESFFSSFENAFKVEVPTIELPDL